MLLIAGKLLAAAKAYPKIAGVGIELCRRRWGACTQEPRTPRQPNNPLSKGEPEGKALWEPTATKMWEQGA